MNDYEFDMNMKKITQAFPQFSREKCLILHDRVQHLSEMDFSRICERLITTQRTAPSIADFLEMAAPFFRDSREGESVQGTCGKCEDGLVWSAVGTGFAVAKCPCRVGLKREENIPFVSGHGFSLYSRS